MTDEPTTWHIGVSPWIIQDGNYDDFFVGQTAEFALEFYPRDLLKEVAPAAKSVKHIYGTQYQVIAEVVCRTEEVWVLDFGLSAFQETRPPDAISLGAFVSGTISLGIDPFFYFERLSKHEVVPPLIYTWNIKRIVVEAAPAFLSERDGQKMFIPDASQLLYKEIGNTGALGDLTGAWLEHTLLCAKLLSSPKRTSDTAK